MCIHLQLWGIRLRRCAAATGGPRLCHAAARVWSQVFGHTQIQPGQDLSSQSNCCFN